MAYASGLGHVLLDRELYLPEEWTNDRERCRQAGIPDDRDFATKPQLAQQMLARAFAAGMPAQWVTGDSVYGHARQLRMWLEERPQAYVLAVSGQGCCSSQTGGDRQVLKTLVAALPPEGWTRRSAGDGTKGPRWYDWRWLPLAEPQAPGWRRWLLVRRSLSLPTELTAYLVFAPRTRPWPKWCRSRGSGGPSKAALKPPRARWAWTTMRCGVGPGGIGISRSRCGPTHSWWSYGRAPSL